MKNNQTFLNDLDSFKEENIDKNILYFYLFIVGIFLSIFIWTYFAKVDEIARGSGKVIPSSKLKVIQSLDGGMILDILVHEGEIVKKGQTLMKIDPTRFQASLQGNEQTYYHLLATKQRLLEESKIDLDRSLDINYTEKLHEKIPTFIKNDEELFHSHVEKLRNTLDFYSAKFNEKSQEIKELEARTNGLRKRLKLAKLENDTLAKLVKNGSRSNMDLISSTKELTELNQQLQETKISIKKSTFAMDGAKNQISEQLNTFRSRAAEQMQKVDTEIKKYESKIVSESDKLDKTLIVSPVNGVIKQINFNTIGGVIKSGMDLMEIVPQSEVLLVEAKISPKDIAFINPKQKAVVKITAYDFSIYGGLEGKIVEISADSIVDKDDRARKSYYKVVIKTDKNFLIKNGEKLPIIPGMVTSVDIITGQKSILDFLLKPILKTKQNALHER